SIQAFKQNESQYTMNLDALNDGVYFIRIKQGDKIYNAKIIVTH
ncbi:MAG: hypothetical protein ACI9UJ_002544, partial [bacterium]